MVFGREWTSFDQRALPDAELQRLFAAYFAVFPFDSLPPAAQGFDLGCGSGRWARLAAERVGHLHCIDASAAALAVARAALAARDNVSFHQCHRSTPCPSPMTASTSVTRSACCITCSDTAAGIASCVAKLRPGAPFLVYLYYAFEQRPAWFRALWRTSDAVRRVVSRAPWPLRYAASQLLALMVYWPLARAARWLEARGHAVDGLPLMRLSSPELLHHAHRCARPLRHTPRTALQPRADCRHDGRRGAERHPLSRRPALLVRRRAQAAARLTATAGTAVPYPTIRD
ncbi:MAG: class I SAM-dependent methyltransferase [Polyangiaceae bacterium]